MEQTFIERRSEGRISLHDLHNCFLSIARCGGRTVHSKKKPVIVLDISLSGMRFISDLQFPLDADYVLSFELDVFKRKFQMEGRIVRFRKIGASLIEYGVRFTNREDMRRHLEQVLNDMLLRLSPYELRAHQLYKYMVSHYRPISGNADG